MASCAGGRSRGIVKSYKFKYNNLYSLLLQTTTYLFLLTVFPAALVNFNSTVSFYNGANNLNSEICNWTPASFRISNSTNQAVVFSKLKMGGAPSSNACFLGLFTNMINYLIASYFITFLKGQTRPVKSWGRPKSPFLLFGQPLIEKFSYNSRLSEVQLFS